MSTPEAAPLAVVTGASSGIGLELAKVFAQNGFDLVVTAEDAELTQAARELEGLGTHVEALQADLATPEGVEDLARFVTARSRPIDALALNAGRGAGGRFVGETALEDELEIVDLNVRSTVHLAKRVLPGMVERGQGRVLITSSIASTMPGPNQAVYNASKSFTQSFAEALHQELKDTGVTVTALMPGPTDTEFFAEADIDDADMAKHRDPAEKVAEQGYKAMMAGEEKVVAGSLMNRVQAKAGAVIPDALKAKVHEKLVQKDGE